MLEKITEQELDQYGVVSAPDHLTGRPADVKAVFDRLVKELVAGVVNGIIDAHNGLDENVNKRIDDVIEELKNVSQINAENLGSNNIALDKAGETALAELYATGELVPTVHGALKKLGALGAMVDYLADPGTFLKPETAALFGLDETAVPDDVFKKTGHVVFGSYEGTGSYGQDNPNTLAFSFAPKLIMFFDAYGAFMPVAGGYTVTPTNGLAFSPQVLGTEYSAGPPLFVTNTGNHTMSKRSKDGKTISWYTKGNSAVSQYNNAGTTYHYIAIG